MLHISKKHNILVFIKSLYKLDYVATYVSICVTYMVLGEQDQTIISSYVEDNPNIPFREISASNKEIRIWGAETKSSSSYIQIDHTEEN